MILEKEREEVSVPAQQPAPSPMSLPPAGLPPGK